MLAAALTGATAGATRPPRLWKVVDDGRGAGVDAGADLETQGFPHHMENSLHDMYLIRQLRRKTSVLSDK